MAIKNKTVIKRASQIYQALETREGRDGYFLKDGSPEWMRDVILNSVDGFDTSFENLYRMANRISGAISEAGEDEDLEDVVYSIEPDIYTRELVNWLSSDLNHVYYLTQVLEEHDGIKDGFSLLALAQGRQISDIGERFLENLRTVKTNKAKANA